MGAWGINNFENDDASDWVYELESSKDKSVIHKALNTVIENTEYIESPECSEALAAAEVVLSGITNDHSNVSEEVSKWLSKKPGLFKKQITFDSSDVKMAIKAVSKIVASSELKELWEETEEYDTWKNIENNLVEKLSKHA